MEDRILYSHLDQHSLVIGVLQQFRNDTFDIFANITGLCQRGAITNSKRNIQTFGNSLCEQRFARPGRSQHQNIAFLQLQLMCVFVQQFGARLGLCGQRWPGIFARLRWSRTAAAGTAHHRIQSGYV